jgi:inhibitor of KinA
MPSEIMYLEGVEYPRFFPLAEYASVVEFGTDIAPAINARVSQLCSSLATDPFPGMRELVPAYASLTVYFDPVAVRRDLPGTSAWESVREVLMARIDHPGPGAEADTPCVDIPVCYDPSLGPDLAWVAAHCGLPVSEVVRIHHETEYRVYMNGFIPGFAYLGLTNAAIDVPRRPEPTVVAKGSVAIAGRQTGIYPASITGGWRVIGRTPMVMFDPARNPAVLLRTGMRVRFRPIDLDSYTQQCADGPADH